MEPTAPDPGPVTLTQLAYAVAVDAHRHFGRAAAACDVTQPTLSMQIGKLERALGVVLFDRARSPVTPTAAGRRVVDQARVALREAARVRDAAGDPTGEVAGELRLGVIPTLAPYLLPRLVPELARRHPRLALVVEERVTDDVLDGVRRGLLDAALVATPAAGADLVERPLFREPFLGYVGPSHRLAGRTTIAPADLSLDDLWLLAEGHCFRTQTVRLCGQRGRRAGGGVAPSGDVVACTAAVRFESGNLETLKRLVERDVGMTLLPALAAADLPPAQRALLRPFRAPAPSRDVRVVLRRGAERARLVEAVAAAIVATLPAELLRPTARERAG